MFGREILQSKKINDVDRARKLINPDSRTHLPKDPEWRPHPRFLYGLGRLSQALGAFSASAPWSEDPSPSLSYNLQLKAPPSRQLETLWEVS
jgi:hypothetical protein